MPEYAGQLMRQDEELTVAQAKLGELQKTVNVATAQRDVNARQAASLEAKVNELTQLVREREQALDRNESEVAKGRELLEHDRDIRELMGLGTSTWQMSTTFLEKERRRLTVECSTQKVSG